jgi:hypothetical protein
MIKGSVGKGVSLAFIAKAYFLQSFNIVRNRLLSSSNLRLSANPFQDSISFVIMSSSGNKLNLLTGASSNVDRDISNGYHYREGGGS